MRTPQLLGREPAPLRRFVLVASLVAAAACHSSLPTPAVTREGCRQSVDAGVAFEIGVAAVMLGTELPKSRLSMKAVDHSGKKDVIHVVPVPSDQVGGV
jgi:hypothetical protein